MTAVATGITFAAALAGMQATEAQYRRTSWDERIAYVTYQKPENSVVSFLGQKRKRHVPGRYVLVLRSGQHETYEWTDEDMVAIDWELLSNEVFTAQVGSYYKITGLEPGVGDLPALLADTAEINVNNAVAVVNLLIGKTLNQAVVVTGTDAAKVTVPPPGPGVCMLIIDTQTIVTGGALHFNIAITELGYFTRHTAVTVNVDIPTVEITAFDAIANESAGTVAVPLYVDATAVKEALPTEVNANVGTITVPVEAWTDTDTYDKTTAGSYTFTAVLGDLPDHVANTGAFTATIEVVVAPVEITAFDAIADVAGGVAGAATYANAAAVIAALPVTALANAGTITVPVTTWVDTDTYDPAVAGSYTFTATLGELPANTANTGNFTATVEIVITAA